MSDTASRRCYVHIGAPKTGTTLLQKVCFNNRRRLQEDGLLFPEVSLRGYGHHDLAFLLAGSYPEWATPQDRSLDELARQLRTAVTGYNGDILISSENFYLFPVPMALKTLLEQCGALDGRQPRIIVYVRRQDAAHESWYNQTIKAQGATHDFATCIETFRDLWNYALQLDKWIEVFGRDAIIVRPYENAQFFENSLVSDFFNLLGRSNHAYDIPEGRTNIKLNRDALEFQRTLNLLPTTIQQKRKFHHQLMALSLRSAGTGLFDDGPETDAQHRYDLLNSYLESNTAVAGAFFSRADLFFETPDATSSPIETKLTIEKLSAIIGWLMLGSET